MNPIAYILVSSPSKRGGLGGGRAGRLSNDLCLIHEFLKTVTWNETTDESSGLAVKINTL